MRNAKLADKWALWAVSALCLGIPALFILVPMLTFVLNSLWHNDGGNLVKRLTLENYLAFFTDADMRKVYFQTVFLCLGATLTNLVVGYICALYIYRQKVGSRLVLILIFTLPLFTSYIIKMYAIRGILGHRGVINELLIAAQVIQEPITAFIFSQSAIFLTLVVLYLPFSVLPIYLAMERIPENLRLASDDLGGKESHELKHIIFPLSLNGVVVAAVFTFVMTFGDFVTPQMVGGIEGYTFGRIVYSQFGVALNWPLGSALAVILLATSVVVALLSSLLLKLGVSR